MVSQVHPREGLIRQKSYYGTGRFGGARLGGVLRGELRGELGLGGALLLRKRDVMQVGHVTSSKKLRLKEKEEGQVL